jgi:WD40 repeat protein
MHNNSAFTPDPTLGVDSLTVNVTRLQPGWQIELDDYVTAMALSPDNKCLAVVCADGTLTCLNVDTGALSFETLNVQVQALSQVAWSACGNWLAVSGQSSNVSIYAVTDLKQAATKQATTPVATHRFVHQFVKGWVQHITWHPSQPWLLMASDYQAEVWTAETQTISYTTQPFSKAIMGCSWHPELSRQFAVISGDTLQRFDMDKPHAIRQFHWGALLFDMAWSPNAQIIAAATHDQGLHTWEVKTGNDLHMSGYPQRIKALAWHNNSRFLATAGGAEITIWDFSGKGPAGSIPVVLSAHEAPVNQLVYQGDWLLSGDTSGQVFIWQPPAKAGFDELIPPLWAFPLSGEISQLCPLGNDTVLVATGSGFVYRLNKPAG